MNCGVYTITNTDTGKTYVGSAVDIAARWRKHRRELNRGRHHNEILTRAWVKYGPERFVFKTLLVCDRKDALMYEQRAIDVLLPEYNICRKAGSVLGMKRPPFSEIHRLRMSEAHSRRVYSKRTEEQRKRIAEGQTGLAKGPMSEAHKAAISAALKGVKKSPEHVAKVRAAVTGLKRSPEYNARMSAIAKNRPPTTDETRRKLSEALARVWAERKRRVQ